MRFLLLPFAVLYSLVMRMRNLFYDLGLLKSFGFDTPIVSVGNLSAGGTGKTPLTALLVQSCLDRGLRVAIVSRGYHSQIKSGWREYQALLRVAMPKNLEMSRVGMQSVFRRFPCTWALIAQPLFGRS